MDDQSRNLILATALSFLVILAWFLVGPMLFPNAFPPATEQAATAPAGQTTADTAAGTAATTGATTGAATAPRPDRARAQVARRGAGADPAGADRHAAPRGLGLAQRRPARRPQAHQLHRDDPAEFADRDAAESGRREGSLLYRVRLGAGGRADPGRRAGRQHPLDDRERRRAHRQEPGDAALGQRQGPRLPPDLRRRPELHVHADPERRERHRRRGAAAALRDDRPLRQAVEPEELLHPARGRHPHGGRQPRGAEVQGDGRPDAARRRRRRAGRDHRR